MAGSSSSPLVGRTQELGQLQAALDAALAGRASTVFVRGESGVGKSRLLSEVAAMATASGTAVLSGAAIDAGDAAPFWPVRVALRRFLRAPENAWALERLAPWQPELAALVPGMPAAALAPPRTSRDETSTDVLLQVVAALVDAGPLAVLLDDMHWADSSSRRLLLYLLSSLTDERFLLVVAYRDDLVEDGLVHELAQEVQRSRQGAVLTLRPLDREAVRELVPGRDRRLVRAVHEWSGGNPLLVEEIVRSMQDGVLSGIPSTVIELVRTRVRRLPPAAAQVVDAIAIGDEPVPHRVLARVLHDVDDLASAVRAAITTGLVEVDEDGEGYRLRHGIVKDALTGDLLPGERFALHRRYAEALAELPPTDRTTARLAAHWAGAQDWPQALSATVDAARQAQDAFGFAEAHGLWSSALEFARRVHPVQGVDDLLEQAARAAHLAGEHDEAVALVRRRLADEPPGPGATAARLHDQMGEYLSSAGRAQEAVAAHATALRLLPADIDAQTRGCVLAGCAAALEEVGRYAESRAQAEAALRVADSAGLPWLRARVLPTLGFSLAYLGDQEAGLAAVEQGLRAAREAGGAQDVACAYVRRLELLCGPLNRLTEGIDVGREAIAVTAELGLRRTFGVRMQVFVANALFRIGDWNAAAELVDDALAARPTGQAAMELRLARCRLLLGRGDLDAAENELTELETLSPHVVGPTFLVPLLTLRAGLALWRHDVVAARECVRRGVQAVTSGSDDVWLLAPLVWHGFRAESDARTFPSHPRTGADPARVAELRALMDDLVRRADTSAPGVRTIVLGYLRLCEAEASRIDGSPDPQAWERAAAVWEGNVHPYPASYCRLRLAEALLSRRSAAAGAVDALLVAHRGATRLGARPLLAEVDALARSAGVDLARAAAGRSAGEGTGHGTAPRRARAPLIPVTGASPVDERQLGSLTEKERLVLAGVAEGRTNRQIAQRLFISEKTVSVHVSHILAKLGVQTRVQAAMAVHRMTR